MIQIRLEFVLIKAIKLQKNIAKRKAFTVSMADSAHVTECDYFGIVSANDEPDKIKKAGFTVTKSEFVDAPVLNELPMVLECELVSMSDETDYIVGNIINVSAEESVLTAGKIDAAKLNPICYDPVAHNYNVLGEVVGKAFSDGKKIK